MDKRGFSLIVTVTMLVLLSLIAVGLLGLSSTVLRSSESGKEEQIARANARMALQMAIGQLQKYAGDDRRITMAADQMTTAGGGDETSTKPGFRYWTGVYEAWDHELEERPQPEHLAWLVSSLDETQDGENVPVSENPSTQSVKLVGDGTVGANEDWHVEAPLLTVGENEGGIAWWTGDQGLKAAVTSPTGDPKVGLAEIRRELQSVSTLPLELVKTGGERPFEDFEPTDPKVAALTDWPQMEFYSSSKAANKSLFHDFSTRSTGFLINVREGGFRKDLSMKLEQSSSRMPKEPLYQVRGQDGINMEELGIYYNLYKDLRDGRGNYTTGGSVPSEAQTLSMGRGVTSAKRDYELHYKQPTIISYQAVFSLEAKTVTVGGRPVTRLYLVIDPILTFWNPHDVPIVVPRGTYFTVKYFALPYDLVVDVGGRTYICPLIASLSSSDSNYLSLTVGTEDVLAFKPGEVIKFSQSGNEEVKLDGLRDRHKLAGRAGFNFGGGVSLPLRTASKQNVDAGGRGASSLTYSARPNDLTGGKKNGAGNVLSGFSAHSRHFSMTHHSVFLGLDRGDENSSLGMGGMYIDYDFGNKRLLRGEKREIGTPGTKPSSERMYANRFPEVFDTLNKDDTRRLSVAQLLSEKAPILMYSYNAKTETASERGTRSLTRFNPKAHHFDFYDLSQEERDAAPYEIKVEALNSWVNRNLETSVSGNAFFGGGFDASSGTSTVITHSVPREPLASLAALQHSAANGFLFQLPNSGYAALNAREPMAPQIGHAIGNSLAPPMLQPNETSSSISGRRALADHSYLANRALWDDWIFSTVAPETEDDFSEPRSQKEVAEAFLSGEGNLLNPRYQPNVGEEEPSEILAELFGGNRPTAEAIEKMAAYIKVEGLFNVNSTSVEAWKTLLSGLYNKPIVTQDGTGVVSQSTTDGDTPVSGLFSPTNDVASRTSGGIITNEAQWAGRRELNEGEIEALALGIVREVRKRGPFLSLSDFVNRRPNGGKEQAVSGAVHSAINSKEVALNSAFEGGTRSVGSAVASRFAFPEAEEGAKSEGIPGVIKQADILTPIAPLLSVRSDTFIVRGYGESRGPNGKVIARAWCEAQVQREADYLVPSEDERDVLPEELTNQLNQNFGRRFRVLSFRWLNASEV